MDANQQKIDIKIKLAKKYEHLANLAGSKGKVKQYAYKAARYRRQATQMERELPSSS